MKPLQTIMKVYTNLIISTVNQITVNSSNKFSVKKIC